jgi:hypothetical protein
MKTNILPIVMAFGFFVSPALAADGPNDLVKFLAGNWENISFEIADGRPVKRESYSESMLVKDNDTLTITAHAFREGKDLIKDMHIVVRGHHAVLSQGPFKAKGRREGNAYYFTGKDEGKEYRLRVYTMGDKYVFHREIWSAGQIEEIDMSYLLRQK